MKKIEKVNIEPSNPVNLYWNAINNDNNKSEIETVDFDLEHSFLMENTEKAIEEQINVNRQVSSSFNQQLYQKVKEKIFNMIWSKCYGFIF